MGLARIWKHRYTHSHAATHVNSIVTKKVWWFLKKLHTELPYEWLYIVILWGIYVFQRTESVCPHKNLCTNVYSGIIHNSEEVGTTQRFTKLWHIHTNLKKTDDHPAIHSPEVLRHVTTWMNPETIMLRERSQTQKTYCMIPFLWNIYNSKSRETESRLVTARGLGGDGECDEKALQLERRWLRSAVKALNATKAYTAK